VLAAGGRVDVAGGFEPCGDGGHAEMVFYPPGEDAGDGGHAGRVGGEAGFGAALGGFAGHGVGDADGGVPVGGVADVPPGYGVLAQAVPGFFLDLEAEVLGYALFHAADQDGGGGDFRDGGGLVGGEQGHAFVFEVAFEFQRVERVPARSFDVFADHGGERRVGRGGLVEQLGQSPVTRQAHGGELLPGAALGAVFDVDGAGFDVPVMPGDVPPGREPFFAVADLPAQRRVGVLQDEGGGAAQHRDRDRRGRGLAAGHGVSCRAARSWRWCRAVHLRASMMASAWRVS
jgi:hypothetical protein